MFRKILEILWNILPHYSGENWTMYQELCLKYFTQISFAKCLHTFRSLRLLLCLCSEWLMIIYIHAYIYTRINTDINHRQTNVH